MLLRKALMAAPLLFVSIAMISCNTDTEQRIDILSKAGSNLVLSGIITDGNDTPLANVPLSLTDSEGMELNQVTDANGYYEFIDLQPQLYTLVATLDGYQTHTSTIDMSIISTIGTHDIELSVEYSPVALEYEITTPDTSHAEVAEHDTNPRTIMINSNADSVQYKVGSIGEFQNTDYKDKYTFSIETYLNGETIYLLLVKDDQSYVFEYTPYLAQPALTFLECDAVVETNLSNNEFEAILAQAPGTEEYIVCVNEGLTINSHSAGPIEVAQSNLTIRGAGHLSPELKYVYQQVDIEGTTNKYINIKFSSSDIGESPAFEYAGATEAQILNSSIIGFSAIRPAVYLGSSMSDRKPLLTISESNIMNHGGGSAIQVNHPYFHTARVYLNNSKVESYSSQFPSIQFSASELDSSLYLSNTSITNHDDSELSLAIELRARKLELSDGAILTSKGSAISSTRYDETKDTQIRSRIGTIYNIKNGQAIKTFGNHDIQIWSNSMRKSDSDTITSSPVFSFKNNPGVQNYVSLKDHDSLSQICSLLPESNNWDSLYIGDAGVFQIGFSNTSFPSSSCSR
jgi:hypothetical protein